MVTRVWICVAIVRSRPKILSCILALFKALRRIMHRETKTEHAMRALLALFKALRRIMHRETKRSASHLLSASRQVSSHQHLHHICCRRHVTCRHIYIHMVVDCEQAGCVRTPHHTLELSVTDGHACSAFMHTTLRDRQECNARAIDILLAVVEQFRPLTVCSGASI